jgi:uncharacterized repeat protein (TIGR01451 family)
MRIADLTVDTFSTPTTITAGMAIDYYSVITNSGPDPAPGTRFINPTPAGLVSPTWTCTAPNGASCPVALGSGAIDERFNLPSGGTLVYIVSGTVATPVPAQITNVVQVFPTSAAPSFVFDPDLDDLIDTETDVANTLFANGFEGGALATPQKSTTPATSEETNVSTIDLRKNMSGSLLITPTTNWRAELNHGIWPLAILSVDGNDQVHVDARFIADELNVRISTRSANGIWQFGNWTAFPAKLWTLSWSMTNDSTLHMSIQADSTFVKADLAVKLTP